MLTELSMGSYYINELISLLQDKIDEIDLDYSDDMIDFTKTTIQDLKKVEIFVRRLSKYFDGDDDEDSFKINLNDDLDAFIRNMWKDKLNKN